MAIIKYKDKDGKLHPLGATGDHSHSLESLGAAAEKHPHDVATAEQDGFMSKGAKAALDQAGKDIEKLETLLGNDQTPVSEKIAQAVEAEAKRALEEEKGLDTRLSIIENDYLVTQDKTSLEQQIAAAEESAVDRVLGYAEGDTVSTDFDTLKKVATWIASDIDESEKLTGRVSAIEGDHLTSKDKDELDGKIAKNSGDITTLNGQVASKVAQSDFDIWTAKMPPSGTVAELVNSTVEGLNITQYATNNDLDSAEARIAKLEALPQGDATASASGFMSSGDKQKLDGIASGANNYVHAIHTSAESGLYKVTVDGEGHVSGTSKVEKSDITGLGIPSQDTTYKAATNTTEGLMSADDKSALDNLSSWVTGSVSEAISEAIEKHGHKYAKSDSDGGAADAAKKVSNSLTVQLNGGTTEGTTMFTFNGSTAKTINIQPSNIGAAPNSNFKGASSTQAGTAGLVPAPTKGTTGNFLKSDGTWGTPPNDNTTYSAGTGISLSGTTFSNSGVRSVSAGSTNGTISVNTGGKSTDVSVKGLGSAAYTDSGKYESSGAAAEALAAANKYTDEEHYTSKNVVTNSSTSQSNAQATNGNVRINSVENNTVTSSHKITGSGATTVTTDSNGNIVISSTDNNTTYNTFSTTASGLVPKSTSTSAFLRGDGYWATPTNTTYSVMTGAGSSSAGSAGLVPQPAAGANTKYLRGDGTWQTPPNDNTTYSTFGQNKNGLVPGPSSTSTSYYLRADGTWATPTNTTYSTFSTSSNGLVPKPTSSDTTKYLRGDGTWQTPASSYTLPTASSTQLGGVKVGSGLSINASGVLSATGGSYSTFDGSNSGLVPKPNYASDAYFLSSNGDWNSIKTLYATTSTSKMWLAGVESLDDEFGEVHGNSSCYMQNGNLYSNGTQVSTVGHNHGITHGKGSVTVNAGASTSIPAISYGVSYSATPTVVISIYNATQPQNISISAGTIGKTSFTPYVANMGSSQATIYYSWIAIGL